MKKTRIARAYETDIMEKIIENAKELSENLQDIAMDLYKTINNKQLNKEEEIELYEMLAELIGNISDIYKKDEKIEKKILNIKNYEETELKDE